MSVMNNEDPRLPFPSRRIAVHGGVVEEYVIPEDRKREVLRQLYPFVPTPRLHERRLDIHAGKTFTIRQFRVTREGGMNVLVSPYYPESGGTVIDWMPCGRGRT